MSQEEETATALAVAAKAAGGAATVLWRVQRCFLRRRSRTSVLRRWKVNYILFRRGPRNTGGKIEERKKKKEGKKGGESSHRFEGIGVSKTGTSGGERYRVSNEDSERIVRGSARWGEARERRGERKKGGEKMKPEFSIGDRRRSR